KVVAGPVEVATRRRAGGRNHPAVANLDVLDHDHGVRACGDDTAGQDRGRRTRRQLAFEGTPGRRLTDHTQPAARVRGPDRIAVDRAGWERGELARRDEVLDQDP